VFVLVVGRYSTSITTRDKGIDMFADNTIITFQTPKFFTQVTQTRQSKYTHSITIVTLI